jgi:hypothetical protein
MYFGERYAGCWALMFWVLGAEPQTWAAEALFR